MPRERRLDVSPHLTRLLDAESSAQRARILLEVLLAQTGASGAQLWSARDGSWRPVLGLGEGAARIPEERVRARLEERIPESALPPGEAVVWPRTGEHAVALGGCLEADQEDLVEALLLVHSALERGAPEDRDPAPLPRPS